MSCDILLKAIIYSKSSLDWNDQLAARNVLWSKLSHSLLQDGYRIFIRCVFCNQNQQGVERSVINALLQKERERSPNIEGWRGPSFWQLPLPSSYKGDVSSWHLESAVRARAQRQFWLLLWPGRSVPVSNRETRSPRRGWFLIVKCSSSMRIAHSVFPVFSTILENNVLLFPSKFLAKCPHSILVSFPPQISGCCPPLSVIWVLYTVEIMPGWYKHYPRRELCILNRNLGQNASIIRKMRWH